MEERKLNGTHRGAKGEAEKSTWGRAVDCSRGMSHHSPTGDRRKNCSKSRNRPWELMMCAPTSSAPHPDSDAKLPVFPGGVGESSPGDGDGDQEEPASFHHKCGLCTFHVKSQGQ